MHNFILLVIIILYAIGIAMNITGLMIIINFWDGSNTNLFHTIWKIGLASSLMAIGVFIFVRGYQLQKQLFDL